MDFKNLKLNALMKQAQEMQGKMQQVQKEIELIEVTGKAGGENGVEVYINGKHVVKKVKIHPELINEDIEVLEDLLVSAFNDASRTMEALSKEKLSVFSQGLNLEGINDSQQ